METFNLKKPVKYDKIPLKLLHLKGGYHMFTGLKHQLELTDTLIDDILPQDNELIKVVEDHSQRLAELETDKTVKDIQINS